MHLAHFDTATFLRDFWQQRPLLIRNPWAAWHNPLDPDELAGLACEEGVEARLVRHAGDRLEMENGPLPASRFGALGRDPWTLLVQAVDHHVPEVAALIAPFRFVPDWRIDDVMVSYATDGGGVGPHFDQYDVFLVQGLGQRRWQVGPVCDDSTTLREHDDLRLIADFTATEEYLLDPGDILYLPPRFAHDGVAVGDDCMTYSIGFRAPALAELVQGWSEAAAEGLDDDARYTDPGLAAQDNPGEITAGAISRMHEQVQAALGDRAAFARWFGGYSSLPKYPEVDWRPEHPVEAEDVRALLAAGIPLIRNPAARFCFVREDSGGIALFVNGAHHTVAAKLAETLCADAEITLDPALAGSGETVELLMQLLADGSIAFDEGD